MIPLAGSPPYRIPLLSEIEAIPWNGLKVASTFSGCGGSCLGYRMAGFKVVWANDCDPAAQASYLLNHVGTVLDPRDIRSVKPEEILFMIGLKVGELDLFDGSPPCTSFSTAGKREKLWGKKTEHAGISQTIDDLFFEYIRLLRGIKPKVFVAENVSGLVRGTAKGYFKIILRELKASGYRVEARIIDAQWLGVPQMRQRVIFVGVREDLGLNPEFPLPWAYRRMVRDAIGDLIAGVGSAERMALEFDQQIISNDKFEPKFGSLDRPHPTIMSGGPCGSSGELRSSGSLVRRKLTIAEVKRICSFPDDFKLAGSYAQQWARLGNSVPPLMMKAIAEVIRDRILQPNP